MPASSCTCLAHRVNCPCNQVPCTGVGTELGSAPMAAPKAGYKQLRCWWYACPWTVVALHPRDRRGSCQQDDLPCVRVPCTGSSAGAGSAPATAPTLPLRCLRCSNWKGYLKLVLADGPLMATAAASYARAACKAGTKTLAGCACSCTVNERARGKISHKECCCIVCLSSLEVQQ